MSHFINPQLVEDYVDDFVGKSVQGVYQGTLDVPQERMLDKRLKAEYNRRVELLYMKHAAQEELQRLVDKIVRLKKKNADDARISLLRNNAVEQKEKIEEIDKKIIETY